MSKISTGKSNKRVIMHYDMDAFYASIEIRDNPTLAGKPMAVGGGVISTASYEARKYGVHSAMSVVEARRLCPKLILLPPNMDKYEKEADRIHSLVLKMTDKAEFVASDEGYVDISNVVPASMTLDSFAEKFRSRIYEITGLTCSVGIGFNKLSAKIASEIKKPNGHYVFESFDGFVYYIMDKNIGIIPGIGKVFREELAAHGIVKVQDAYKYGVAELCDTYGVSRGEFVYSHIRGIDHSDIENEREYQSIGNENTFSVNLQDIAEIEQELDKLFDHVYGRLLASGYICKTVSIKVKFASFKTITRSKSLSAYTDDKDKLYSIMNEIIEILEFDQDVRLLGVSFGNLIQKNIRQMELI